MIFYCKYSNITFGVCNNKDWIDRFIFVDNQHGINYIDFVTRVSKPNALYTCTGKHISTINPIFLNE